MTPRERLEAGSRIAAATAPVTPLAAAMFPALSRLLAEAATACGDETGYLVEDIFSDELVIADALAGVTE